MNISYNWLKSIINIDKTPKEIAEALTQTGLEVSQITPFEFVSSKLIIGEIIQSQQHPNADKLWKLLVNIGGEAPLRIICGAPNVAEGTKVVVAPIGTELTLPNGRMLTIRKAKIRDEISEGMLCAEDEIELGDQHKEIITLSGEHLPGTSLNEALGTPLDTIFEIDLTPNRNDAISHLGIARDLAAVFNLPLEEEEHEIEPLVPEENLPIQIAIKEKKGCARYAAVVIKNITLQPSPFWLQSRLKSIGVRPINNVVDVTNFILHDIGQPLHAFDYNAVAQRQIIIKPLPEGTLFTSLNGTEYILTGKELMVCDTEGPLCMAGIIGGMRGKVVETTQTILLESAYFNPSLVYQAARKHQIASQAAFCFSRGTDPHIPYLALQRATKMIQKLTGGIVASHFEDCYPTKVEKTSIPIGYDYINSVVGTEIPRSEIHRILEKLDIHVQKVTKTTFNAIVPPYRRDVLRPIDIVEEILRIHGFNQVASQKESLAKTMISTKQNVTRRAKKDLKKRLAAQGYHEIITNSLTNSEYNPTNERAIMLENPNSQRLDSLRTTLLFSGLEVIQHNLKRQHEIIKLFETGYVYSKEQTKFHEDSKLGIWLTGYKEAPNWTQKEKKTEFSDLYTTLQNLLYTSGITMEPLVQELKYNDTYIGGISLQDTHQTYGHLGILNPALLKKFEIDDPVFFAEINLDLLLRPQKCPVYQPISKFPLLTRDLSLSLPDHVSFLKLRKTIDGAAIPELQKVSLIDLYKNASLGAGRKSYTIRLVLQSHKATLKEKEIHAILSKLSHVLTTQVAAVIRE